MRKNVGTQEAIAKMKNSKKGQKTWLGKTHSKESKIKQSNSAKSRNITIENEALRRDNISKAMKLIKRSQEWKDNISDSKKGEKHPMFGVKGCENPRSKKVLQYNLNGDYIRCWCNTQQISDKLGINYKAINNCLTGKTKSSGGFYWKYNNQ